MRHQQVLDKLTAAGHVRALDEDLARWVGWQMLRPKTPDEMERAVIPPILTRWRCLLDADDVPVATRNVVWVALATLLHKYGLRDDVLTTKALTAVDELNRDVVLSDTFARQSGAITSFLRSAPTALTRRPRQPRPVTFLRVGDVVSLEADGRFHAAFVRSIHGANEFPIIEFYAGTFARRPTVEQLSGLPAARERGRARFGVAGMTYLPDPANQIVAVASRHPEAPHGAEPGPTDGLWTMTDLIGLQRDMAKLFDHT